MAAAFAFAGLWEHWQSPEGSEIESCTIITTAANALMQPIHDRMPVILQPQDYEQWLDPAIQTGKSLQPLLRPYPDEAMMTYPVSKAVNNPRHDRPDCIEPAEIEPAKIEPAEHNSP
jgi:putative SOS response-associated peptidase YedK